VCHALTVRDERTGLVTAEEIRVGAHEGSAGVRFSVHGFYTGSHGHRGQVRGPVGGGPIDRLVCRLGHLLQAVAYCGRPAGR
jgi:hypothetical protein